MHQEMAIGGRQRRFLPQTANSRFTSVRHVTIGVQALFQRHHLMPTAPLSAFASPSVENDRPSATCNMSVVEA